MQCGSREHFSLLDLVRQQDWLEEVAAPLQDSIRSKVQQGGAPARWFKNFLHGTWLGHSLHPAITDVPVGAWTAAMGFDLADAATGRDLSSYSNAAIGVGLAGSVGATVSGLADWSETYGEERRLGLAHALLNVAATVLFGLSLVSRLRGRRSQGVALGMLGYTAAVTGAYLGGDLVFRLGTGVNHGAWYEPPSKFTAVMNEADLPENEPKRVMAGRAAVLLVRRNGQVHAISETCSHAGGPLSKGQLEDGIITCPWHGSQFRVDTGEVVSGPAAYHQPCLEVRVHEGAIEVRRARRP